MMKQSKTQNEKIIKLLTQKMKDGQILLMLFDIIWHSKDKPQSKLIITSKKLYLVSKLTIKKYFQAQEIQSLILTPFSPQLLIFYNKGQFNSKQNVRIQSNSNVKIVQYIITVREKFQNMKEKLNVLVTLQQNLQHYSKLNQNTNLFSNFFKRKTKSTNTQSTIMSNDNSQYFEVTYKDFILLIGQRMYKYIFHNTKLLYANNNQTFRFQQQKFNVQQLGPQKKKFTYKQSQFYKKQKVQKSIIVIQRKISKISHKQSHQQDLKISQYLTNYKNQQYKQQLLYALQSQTHFSILTSLHEGQKNCQQILHQHQNSFFYQKDLKCIFFKLMQMIQNTHLIFHSLSPQNIILGKDEIRISQLFSFIKKKTQIDYLAPQQLINNTFTSSEIQLINLWKVGILIFQLSYGNVPFPLQYIAYKLFTKNTKLSINFPQHIPRTTQFQQFIKSILKINANQRGIPQLIINSQNNHKINNNVPQWKNNIVNSTWLKYK